jgi:acetyltransferase-like isoleucine patch superfamily enzyme
VNLGKDVAVAANSYLIGSAGYEFTPDTGPMIENPKVGQGIRIEDNVWLGAGVYVTDGNSIGSGSIIGAGSIVTKDIPRESIAVGVPAEVVKTKEKSTSDIMSSIRMNAA